MKTSLINLAHSIGISQIGITAAEVYTDLGTILAKHSNIPMTTDNIDERINPFLLMPSAKSVIVCLFPYYSGSSPSNISKYACGEDYHYVINKRLSTLKEFLENHGYTAQIYADSSPLNDRYLAYKAGLGFIGKNGFLINPEYGSYTFIGYILTDCSLLPDSPTDISCMQCMKCIQSCPGKAIGDNHEFTSDNCLSYITQKKGELSDTERTLIRNNGSAWGCDVCQDVCPHNKNIPVSPLSEFTQDLIHNLDIDENLSNKDFKQMYANRAFTWRGKSVISRNLSILKENK